MRPGLAAPEVEDLSLTEALEGVARATPGEPEPACAATSVSFRTL